MKLFAPRDRILFALVTSLHIVASLCLLGLVFGHGMARFDTGGPSGLTERIAGWLLNVLAFPMVTALGWLPGLPLPGLWGYIPFVLNASIWGLGAVVVRRRIRVTLMERERSWRKPQGGS